MDAPFVKIAYEDKDQKVQVELKRDTMTAREFRDELVKPLMVAAGYHPKSVDEALPTEE